MSETITITPGDIKKGDRIRAVFSTGRVRTVEYIADFDADIWESWATHYLIEEHNPLPVHPFALIKVASYTPIVREEHGGWHHVNEDASQIRYTRDSLWRMIKRDHNGEFTVLYEGYPGL